MTEAMRGEVEAQFQHLLNGYFQEFEMVYNQNHSEPWNRAVFAWKDRCLPQTFSILPTPKCPPPWPINETTPSGNPPKKLSFKGAAHHATATKADDVAEEHEIERQALVAVHHLAVVIQAERGSCRELVVDAPADCQHGEQVGGQQLAHSPPAPEPGSSGERSHVDTA